MKTKLQNSKRLVKRKRQVTKKRKQIGAGHEPTKFEDIVNFFNIEEPDYFKGALHDALGLYSLINWKGDTYYTFNNHNNKSIKIIDGNYDRDAKYKPDFVENSIYTSTFSKAKYTYLGVFYKAGVPAFKTAIFKNATNNNYIILFKWAGRVHLFGEKYELVITKIFEFIMSKIDDSAMHVMLFGFSMGGNIAQQIALKFIDANTKLNVSLVSLGIGDTLTEELKLKLETKLAGKFISVALIQSANTFSNPSDFSGKINSYILTDYDSPGYTIKTIMLDTHSIGDEYTGKYHTFNLKHYYDYDRFAQRKFSTRMANTLHNFKLYRQYLLMLIEGETKLVNIQEPE